MSHNHLGSETSPYLLQHKDNPVHWRVWGAAALEEARSANKPLLVSVGYAACHWCHVMAHESFEDQQTADLMNALYIPVKIDREERPDIDAWLMNAVQALGQNGGWPLTAFLTAEGEPFFAGTYFPKRASHGLPDFKSVLQQISDVYKTNSAAVVQNTGRIAEALARGAKQNHAGVLDPAILDKIALATAHRFDLFHGGMQGAPKFPNTGNLELLWRAYIRSGQDQYRQIVTAALDGMCQGGIYDHLAGGFARYSTDAIWLVPHFEKMLYDNALLIDILTLVAPREKKALYKRRVVETVQWLLSEMRVEKGFASSLDADSLDTEGHLHEGAFYVWTEAEIDAALGEGASAFKSAYGVTKAGNFEDANILNRIGKKDDAEELALAGSRATLLAIRNTRPRPGRDDKVLCDWNGLAIAALANAGLAFGEPAWIEAAAEAFAFVREKLGAGAALSHTYRAGKTQHPAFSDGYANMARAGLVLWEATGEDTYLEAARGWVQTLDEDFWDTKEGGYVFAHNPEAPAKIVIRNAFDSAMPTANGTMLGVLIRLYLATGDEAYRVRAEALAAAFGSDAQHHYLQMATYLNGFDDLVRAQQIVIVGARGDSGTRALIQAVLEHGSPHRLLMVVAPGHAFAPEHPAHGKTQMAGAATAYLCQGRSCSAPVTEPGALTKLLAGLH